MQRKEVIYVVGQNADTNICHPIQKIFYYSMYGQALKLFGRNIVSVR